MDKIPIQTIPKLLEDYLLQQQYSKLTQTFHRRNVRKLLIYTKEVGSSFYDLEIGSRFLSTFSTKSKLKQHQTTINVINKIILGVEPTRRGVKSLNFPANESGNYGRQFIEYIRERRLSSVSEYTYARHAYLFIMSMTANGMSFGNVTREFILSYVGRKEKGTTECSRCVRHLLQFLFEKGVMKYDYAPLLKKFKTRTTVPPISFYQKEEIKQLEDSVDRNTPRGKRDYAMILLASRLGLRSSDILQLKFENLDWDRSLIVLTQYKTKRNLKLPIIKEVGEALIEYILNVRPKSESKNIFLSMQIPHAPLRSMTDLVKRYFIKSGIEIKGRKHGPHSLRHSLATTMLNNGTSLPVISEALGHSNTDSTMCYLTVGLRGLVECSLDVTPISDSFYNQRDGIFYEET